jgi:hypothetical protein
MQYSTKTLEDSLLVKFFSVDDNMVVNNKLSNSTTIDGTKFYGKIAPKTYIETQIPFNQVKNRYDNAIFEYGLNKNGEISYLDLPYKTTVDQAQNLITTNRANESKNSLNLAFASGSTLQYYRPNLLTFGNRVSAKSSAIVLRIPDDRKNYDFYERTTFEQTFISGESYLVDGYTLNENSRVCDIVVAYTNGDTSFRFLAPILIDKITEITNVDGVPTYKIYGYSRGGNVEFIVADDLVNKFNSDAQKKADFKLLSKGDIVEITVDAFKKINNVTLKYRHSTIPANIKYTAYGSIAAEQRYVAGDIYSVVDNLSSFIPINPDSKVADMTVLSNIEIISLGIAKVFVVENNKITVGNVDSFNDYLRYGTARSRVFVFTEFAQPRYVVVYK